MIVYFADRASTDIVGWASTASTASSIPLFDDVKTEEVETGVNSFECSIGYTDDNRQACEAAAAVGNYILRHNGTENEFYTITESETDTKDRKITVYAEDAGLELINDVALEFSASKALPITDYLDQYIGDSGFEVGINEIPSTETRKLSWDSESTCTERIADIAEQFGAEVSYSFEVKRLKITHKYLNIFQKRGKDVGETLRLNREIDRIIAKRSIQNLCTAVYATGATLDGQEKPMDLTGYKLEDDGDIYLEKGILKSRTALQKWGQYRVSKSPKQGEGHIIRTFSCDADTQKEICDQAIETLKKYREPEVNYELELNSLPENIQIGDRINIVDESGKLYLSSRLLKLETSIANGTRDATIGDFLLKTSGLSDKVKDLADIFEQNHQRNDTTPYVSITADSYVIKYDSAGKVVGNAYSTLTAETRNVTIATWQYMDASGEWQDYPTTGDNASISGTTLIVGADHEVWSNDTAKIKVLTSNDTVYDTITITKLRDGGAGEDGNNGENAVSVVLDNESQTIATDPDGLVLEDTTITIHYTGYSGTTPVPCSCTVNQNNTVAGMTVKTNTAATATEQGTIVITAPKSSDLGGKANGIISLNFRLENMSYQKQFTWSKSYQGEQGTDGAQGLQGLQGEKGEQGIPGEKGEDGRTSYFHIKYSAVENPTSASQMTETPDTYIGTYVDYTEADSTDPSKYTWSRFEGLQGEQGEKGIPGTNGENGKTSYLHIAYANSADGKTSFSLSDATGRAYIGQYTDFTEADSTDPTKYTWSKIQGDKGDQGDPGTRVNYLRNTKKLEVGNYIAVSPASGKWEHSTGTDGFGVQKAVTDGSTLQYLSLVSTLDATEKAQADVPACFSFDIRCDVLSTLKSNISAGFALYRNNGSGEDYTTMVTYTLAYMSNTSYWNTAAYVDGEWCRVRLQGGIPNFASVNIDSRYQYRYGIDLRIAKDAVSGHSVEIRRPKMELGTGMTEWVAHTDDAADDAADIVDGRLTALEVFNRLTDNGNLQGIYRDEETGELYINAAYIAAGILASKGQESWISLEDGTFSFAGGKLTYTTTDGLKIIGKITTTGELVITDANGENPTTLNYEKGDIAYPLYRWQEDGHGNSEMGTDTNIEYLDIDTVEYLKTKKILAEQILSTSAIVARNGISANRVDSPDIYTSDIHLFENYWSPLTLNTGFSQGSYERDYLSYRVIGKHVYISGSVKKTAAFSGNTVVAKLPTAIVPAKNMYRMAACMGSRIARIIAHSDGNLRIEWVKDLSTGSDNTTTTGIWVDMTIDYWLD